MCMTIWNLLYETSVLAYLSYMLTLTTFPWIKLAMKSLKRLEIAESVKQPSSNIVISNIANREGDFKTKADEVNKILEEICGKKKKVYR